MTHGDVTTGVLLERVADYLCVQLRALHGKPTARIFDVPVGERTQMYQFAVGILGLVRTIDGELPPTAAEIQRFSQNKALVLARGRVGCQARANRHRLSVWRPYIGHPGYELAVCERCGAGASIHIETARESLSELLLAPCLEWHPSFSSMTGATHA